MRKPWMVPAAWVAASVLYVVLVGWLMLHGYLDVAGGHGGPRRARRCSGWRCGAGGPATAGGPPCSRPARS